MYVTFAAAGLLSVAPLLVVIAVAIRLDSSRPLLFRQVRVGRDGKRFEMFYLYIANWSL